MIALMLALAVSNMPPPPIDVCPKRDAGSACLTPGRYDGVCATTQCPKTEFSKNGSKTVMVDCLKCINPDGGTR